MERRLDAARKLLESLGLDAILVWNLSNVRYLSGFTGTEGALVLTENKNYFLSDSRYETQASEQVKGYKIRIQPEKIASICSLLTELKLRRVGFEDETIPTARYRDLSQGVSTAEFIALGGRLDEIRLCKDAGEIEVMRRSARAAETGLENALKIMRPGVTENEVALELEIGFRRCGALKPSFDIIVAAGERGALPHGVASDRKIRNGELIVIDFGCVLDGYCSDETVTVALGEVGEEEHKVYEIVREAQLRALEKVRAGVSLKEVDRTARDFIRDAGYGDFFGHGLGHGVGLDIHEGPRVSFRADATAEAGMVVTIEPGIYLPGRFGVRIEDTVVITENGYEKITGIDKHFRQV